MITKNIAKNRTFTNVVLNADYVVAGGGLTGVCSAIAAARDGLRVVILMSLYRIVPYLEAMLPVKFAFGH